MSFTATLTNAISGLNASTLRAEILSYNIANAETPGFTRRSADFESAVPGGVRPVTISVADAGLAEHRLLGEFGREGEASLRSSALNLINDDFGQPGDSDGLYAVFTQFELALDDLRLTPESASAQLALLQAAEDVTNGFATLDAQAQEMRLAADTAIDVGVTNVNNALQELDLLNADAARPRSVSLDTIAERQRVLVSEIATQIDINVTGEYGGELTIRTKGGLLLLGDEPNLLEFNRAGSVNYNTTLASGALSGLTVYGVDITPGAVQGLVSGEMAANFAIRDALATDYADRLDAAAQELVDRLEAADTTAAGGLFAINAGTGSAAQLITINAAIDPGQGGELYRIRDGVGATVEGPAAGDGVLGLIKDALDEQRALPVATGTSSALSYIDMLGALSTQLGTNAIYATGLYNDAAASRTSIEEEVIRQTGVDTDRELQDLILVEQAFAANARVIQAADEMLRQLLEI
ncbi:MAG: flagellar basal body rod C-terminal domain-containing protein [Pseudomonadota bacterium]